MIFNLKFFIILTIILLIVLSFVLNILQSLTITNITEFVFTKGANTVKVTELKPNDAVTVTTLGTTPHKISSDTAYYRYSSLALHVITMLSGMYLLYAN